jgi:hypothetical protein
LSSARKFGIEVSLMDKPLVALADSFLGALECTQGKFVADRPLVNPECIRYLLYRQH